MGFGNEQVVDYNFSFDLCEKCGANTVIGFHNSVNTNYSDYFNCNLVLQLLKNKSVKEAFEFAQSEFGYNDNEFLYKFTDLDQYCDEENKITWREFISNRTAATPILSGETTNKLNHRYEVSSTVKDSTENNTIKDVRVEVIDNSSDSFEPIVITTTDENGNFSLNLPYGSYSLSFHHDNYNYYGMSLDIDSDYVVLQNPILLNPTTIANGIPITNMEIIDHGHYMDNMADSRLNILGEEYEYGYGNLGVDGTVYKNGLEAWIARWNFQPEISWVYNTYELDENYSKLTGNTNLIKCYNTTNFNTTLYIYGDDKLLYSQVLTNDSYNYNFDIDIIGVKEIKIMFKDNIAVKGGTSFAIYDLFLR